MQKSGTTSNIDYWPKPPTSLVDAEKAKRAWSTIKYHMNKVMRHDYELMCFNNELRAKKEVLRFELSDQNEDWHDMSVRSRYLKTISNNTEIIAIQLYDLFSSSGTNVLRPIIALMVFFILFMGVNLVIQWAYDGYGFRIENISEYCNFAAIISFTDTFPLLQTDMWDPPFEPNIIVKILSIIHSMFSVIFFFLIGLGLRNWFRIK